MNHSEIQALRDQLSKILQNEGAIKRLDLLVKLARKVGASTTRMATHIDNEGHSTGPARNEITETEIVDNIYKALQTASTITLCKTASRNLRITFVAVLIALVSALAAWAGVIFNYYNNRCST